MDLPEILEELEAAVDDWTTRAGQAEDPAVSGCFRACSERDQGVERGMLRAYKHQDNPSSEHIAECVKQYVMNELSEVLDWERSG